MASYDSYKKISASSIADGAITSASFTVPLNSTYGVKWFYGSPGACTQGCCCLWTVPTGVKKLQFHLWGAGGNGAGSCSCSRCQHNRGSQGGYYATKIIDVTEGWNYTVCAGGVYPCYSRECTACEGCASYVNGCNLTNFCAVGGDHGFANGSWTTKCSSVNECCVAVNANNADWSQMTHTGPWDGAEFVYDRGFCHCYNRANQSTGAALIGTETQESIRECWIRCGCWTVPYGNGGQNAYSTYCGGNCGQGGTGGGGLVKITYF